MENDQKVQEKEMDQGEPLEPLEPFRAGGMKRRHRSSMFELALEGVKLEEEIPIEKMSPTELKRQKERLSNLSFEEAWKDHYLHSSLKNYAVKKYAEENLLFIEEVLTMKGKRNSEAVKAIYREYIEPQSPLEVNINDATKKEIISQMKSPEIELDLSIFDPAVDELVKLIKESIYGDFLTEMTSKVSKSMNLPKKKKRVVILGGGFLGSTTGRLLDAMGRFEVVLIDTKEYFEYTPEIIHSMVDPEYSKKWRFSYSEIIKNGRIIVGQVQAVEKNYVTVEGERIPFHYLVIATGSSYTSQFKGNNISTSYRLKKIEMEYQGLRAAKNVLVIGGGPVGIEIAAEVATAYPEKKVTLVEGNGTLIKRTPEKAQRLALEELRRLGVEVVLNERVVNFDHLRGRFVTHSGKKFEFDKVYIATGPVPNTQFINESLSHILDSHKQIKVNECLQVEGFQNIFSGGDCSNAPVEKLAFNSAIHGVAIARNICRLEKGKEPAKAGTKGVPKARKVQYSQLISLGPRKSLVIFRVSLSMVSTHFSNFKVNFALKTQEAIQGKRPFTVGFGFGKLPKPLDEDGKVSEKENPEGAQE